MKTLPKIGIPQPVPVSWSRTIDASGAPIESETNDAQVIRQRSKQADQHSLWLLTAVKMVIDIGDLNIAVFRLDLDGGQTDTESFDASPLITAVWSPPDWSSGNFIVGFPVDPAFGWQSPGPGRTIFTIYQPLAYRDLRIARCDSTFHLLARFFGPAPVEPWRITATAWLAQILDE